MTHCPPASITSTVVRSSSSTSGGSAPTLLIRLPSMTMASLRAAALPEPSIRVPLRTTRVFLLAALMMILPVADRTTDVTSKRAASSTAIGSSCEPLAARAARRCELEPDRLNIPQLGRNTGHDRSAIRPLDPGSRQHRQSRARQCLHQRSALGDPLLHHRSRPHP